MNDNRKTKVQLIQELEDLRRKIAEFEKSETKRRQAEEALRESEENYRNFFKNANEAIFVGLDSNIVFHNPKTTMVLGYSSEELGSRPLSEFIHPDDRDMVIDRFVRQIQGQKIPQPYDFRIIQKDSNVRWVVANSIMINWKGRTATLNFLSDITERKHVEEKLREGEKKYRELYDFLPLPVYEMDFEANITSANRAIYETIGGTEEDLRKGFKGWQLLSPEEIEKSTRNIERLLKGEQVEGTEYNLMRLDGSVFPAIVISSLIYSDGKPVGVRGAIIDITDRKRAEETLRKSEEKYRNLVENISDVIFDVDHQGVVLYFSPLGKDIWGYNREDVIGKNFIELIHPDDRDLLLQRFVELSDGIEKPLSYRFKDKAGTFRWVRTSTKPRLENGKFVGASGTLIDITKQIEMETLLRESENRYRELSIVDDLTQLYNSRHFYFQLKIELGRSNRYGQPLTLLLLDLDNFKAFNDAYGHIEGDQVLWRLGQVVKRCLRETDFACRYGGEEFTILLPMTTCADGAVIAERIRAEFRKETFSPTPGHNVHVTVSIGLAQYKPQEELKAFVHRVDQLMYQGNRNGKDRVCSEPQSQVQLKG
jgi:diguanylate cyclase (GGDEF)-like protein/PAS domain S-box-containing protein